MIEGLTQMSGPNLYAEEIAGPLPLPDSFDKKAHLSRWVKDGPQVEKAKESTRHFSAGVVAAGWQTWLGKDNKPCKRALSSGTYILMFRPRNLQMAVNKIHANESRSRMLGELNEGQDSRQAAQDGGGLLSDAHLKAMRQYENDGEAPPLKLHQIDVERETTIKTQ